MNSNYGICDIKLSLYKEKRDVYKEVGKNYRRGEKDGSKKKGDFMESRNEDWKKGSGSRCENWDNGKDERCGWGWIYGS